MGKNTELNDAVVAGDLIMLIGAGPEGDTVAAVDLMILIGAGFEGVLASVETV